MVIWLWYISKGNKCYLFELTCIWISRLFWGKNSWGCWVRYESLSLFISYLLPNLLLEQLPMYRYIVSYLPFALSNQKDSTWWNAHNVAIRWVAGPQLKRHTSIVLLFNTPPMASILKYGHSLIEYYTLMYYFTDTYINEQLFGWSTEQIEAGPGFQEPKFPLCDSQLSFLSMSYYIWVYVLDSYLPYTYIRKWNDFCVYGSPMDQQLTR